MFTAERFVIWTLPPPDKARRAVVEIQALDSIEEPTDAQQQRRAALAADLPKLGQIRIRLTTLSVLQMGRYRAHIREANEYFSSVYKAWATVGDFQIAFWRAMDEAGDEGDGLDMEKIAGSMGSDEATINEAYSLAEHLTGGARALACMAGVDRRVIPILDQPADDSGWKSAKAPAEWETLIGFLDNAPPALVRALAGAADELNPGLWSTRSDEQAKNAGGASVI